MPVNATVKHGGSHYRFSVKNIHHQKTAFPHHSISSAPENGKHLNKNSAMKTSKEKFQQTPGSYYPQYRMCANLAAYGFKMRIQARHSLCIYFKNSIFIYVPG
ncbi:hypothetical protein GWD52_16475 [Enterobacteriaceae bacterium 4M9]|nr:hypothetical protein [Enterobacteriaceae bacterium 4M9]